MSLRGSLETVALPEVLHLLADTAKSGELHVRGSHADGSLWFVSGEVSGYEVGRTQDLPGALFELLRLGAGEFDFETDAPVPRRALTPAAGREDIRPALEEAEARLAEWVDIVSVVPSLDHWVDLAPTAPRAKIWMERSQWSLVVAIGEGHSVQEVLDRADLSEFDGCKAIKVLVGDSLVSVGAPVEAVSITAETFRDNVLGATPILDDDEDEADEEEQDGEDEAGEDDAEYDDYADASELGSGSPQEARNALQQFLAQMQSATTEPVAVPPEPVAVSATGEEDVADGLGDRGPWTSGELTSLRRTEDWGDGDADEYEYGEDDGCSDFVADIDPQFEPADGYDDVEEAGDGVDRSLVGSVSSSTLVAASTGEGQFAARQGDTAGEPMNRGLLLKFLSSVRG